MSLVLDQAKIVFQGSLPFIGGTAARENIIGWGKKHNNRYLSKTLRQAHFIALTKCSITPCKQQCDILYFGYSVILQPITTILLTISLSLQVIEFPKSLFFCLENVLYMLILHFQSTCLHCYSITIVYLYIRLTYSV